MRIFFKLFFINILAMMKRIKLIVSVLILAGSFSSCTEESLEDHKDGIIPSSIEQVVNVFELKYGEVYEREYDGQVLKFSITDVEDNLYIPSATTYIFPESYKESKISAFLCIEIGKNILHLKVYSRLRAGRYLHEFKNDGLDVQHIWDLVEECRFLAENNPDLFEGYFSYHFYPGTLINETQLSIFIAKVYPITYEMNYKPEKSMYKFIFIVTNQKEK